MKSREVELLWIRSWPGVVYEHVFSCWQPSVLTFWTASEKCQRSSPAWSQGCWSANENEKRRQWFTGTFLDPVRFVTPGAVVGSVADGNPCGSSPGGTMKPAGSHAHNILAWQQQAEHHVISGWVDGFSLVSVKARESDRKRLGESFSELINVGLSVWEDESRWNWHVVTRRAAKWTIDSLHVQSCTETWVLLCPCHEPRVRAASQFTCYF